MYLQTFMYMDVLYVACVGNTQATMDMDILAGIYPTIDYMPDMTYHWLMNFRDEKPLVWLGGEIKTPPFSANARIEAGYLLRLLQRGAKLSMPQSRSIPTIGKQCHELRITDETLIWRIIYRTDSDAIVILEIFNKKTNRTPKQIINICKKRLRDYDETG